MEGSDPKVIKIPFFLKPSLRQDDHMIDLAGLIVLLVLAKTMMVNLFDSDRVKILT